MHALCSIVVQSSRSLAQNDRGDDLYQSHGEKNTKTIQSKIAFRDALILYSSVVALRIDGDFNCLPYLSGNFLLF